MTKYYKLRKDLSIEIFGHKLFRIECIKENKSKGIKVGEVGGYIEKEGNLSGDAWVYGDALVYGNARVSGDAQVYGDALVSGDAQVYGNARVYGNAWVYGNARVYGDAWVYGDKIQKYSDICNITNQQYNITITPKHIRISCQYHSKTAWFRFKDSEIEKMDGQRAVDWWKKWKPVLKAICEVQDDKD